MIIGVDFDNTIISYDALFHRMALERDLIPADLPVKKIAVRDHLRRTGREDAWTELQGHVYGPHLAGAPPFAGALEFFRECRFRGIEVFIISHKTRHPHSGPAHDLHAAARGWLEDHGFLMRGGSSLNSGGLFFESTQAAKMDRISACGCTDFIDDLPELLLHPGFPAQVRRILFDPGNLYGKVGPVARAESWPAVGRLLLGNCRADAGSASLSEGAQGLLGSIGRTLAAGPEAIGGGANNRAYTVGDAEGSRYFLKHYFHDPADSRDRFATERAFYAYSGACGIQQVPQALGWDEANRLGLFEFVEGLRPESAEIGKPEVRESLAFLAALNHSRHRAEAKALPDASEACFSVRQHLSMLQRRLDRLQNIEVVTDIDARAAEFVRAQLLPAGAHARRAILEANAPWGGPDELISSGERCISPSDFGFHNCLRRLNGDIVFFDFEYAGWDDPAKTVCDFFCQPAVPVQPGFFEYFADGIASMHGAGRPHAFLARCRALLPIYQLKWCCILLNEFSIEDRGRRYFATDVRNGNDVKERQLARAAAALARAGFYCQQ